MIYILRYGEFRFSFVYKLIAGAIGVKIVYSLRSESHFRLVYRLRSAELRISIEYRLGSGKLRISLL